MVDTELFHAYVIGGARDSAREHITSLGILPNDPAVIATEHVTFTIENARTLRSWQELKPAQGERKIYIAYADFITREAENALLKTLEEPVLGTHIFLVVPNPEILLDTLRSRVRIVSLETAHIETGAKKFLSLSLSERLTFVSRMIEKSDDPSTSSGQASDASAQVREKALGFIGGLEQELSKSLQENREGLEALLKLKKYLYVPGVSVRIILESLALAL